MKVAESAFLKIKLPIKSPRSKSPIVQIRPNKRQDSVVLIIAFRISVSLCFAWASETIGSKSTEMEFVRTVGNMMIANAMPVRIP